MTNLYRKDRHLMEIIMGSGMAFIFKLFGSVLSILLSVYIARMFGAEGAGIYFLVFTFAIFIAALSRIGLDSALIRFSAICAEAGDMGSLSHLSRVALGIVLFSSIIFSLGLYFCSAWLAEAVFEKPEVAKPLAWIAIALLGTSVTVVCTQILKGLKQVYKSQLLEATLTPALILFAVWVWSDGENIIDAVQAFIFASVVTATLGILMVLRYLRQKPPDDPIVSSKLLVYTSFPLMGVKTVAMLMTSFSALFLGRFGSLEDVAIFVAASKAAFVTSILLTSVSTISSPKFSAFSAKGDIVQLERSILQINTFLTAIAAVFLIGYFVFAKQIMAMFGDGFESGVPILMILGVGQFVSVSSGTIGPLLIMCGYQKISFQIMISIFVLNLVLNVTLIPTMGITGAAIATATTMILRNLCGIIAAQRLIGIVAFPLLNMLPLVAKLKKRQVNK